MKLEKLEKSKKVNGAKGCIWANLKAQGIGSPLYRSILKLGEFHFSHYWSSTSS